METWDLRVRREILCAVWRSNQVADIQRSLRAGGISSVRASASTSLMRILDSSLRPRSAKEDAVNRSVSLSAVGHATSLFLAISFTLCVIFDLILPQHQIYSVWQRLLPG